MYITFTSLCFHDTIWLVHIQNDVSFATDCEIVCMSFSLYSLSDMIKLSLVNFIGPYIYKILGLGLHDNEERLAADNSSRSSLTNQSLVVILLVTVYISNLACTWVLSVAALFTVVCGKLYQEASVKAV